MADHFKFLICTLLCGLCFLVSISDS